jgi:large-conductance mechanosensitive channel
MPPFNILIKRLVISLAVGLLIGAAISEIPFLFLRETARPRRRSC